ncbi:hypothetical protein BZG36_01999 [Bifiguratus adelaidae]|uniref:Uncharacterized protein n=1 Tax=Bifiguratus adelaidae TaxID=1938954 RepID=A0A261Y424_9FUNG|nr:hypothetical protein BZG36_01999 [Bifiguratus adelaidae]
MKISSIAYALSLLVVAVNAMPVHEDVTLAKRDADLVDLANALQNADLLNGVNVLSNQNAKRDLINAKTWKQRMAKRDGDLVDAKTALQNANVLNDVDVLSNED